MGTSGFDDVSALRRDDCNEIGHRWVGSSWVWLKCDVSKEEPHIGWIVSGDMNWWRDLVGGGDVYKTAASHAFKCDVSEVDKEQRQIGKRMAMAWLNRARQYGIRKSAWWMTEDEATEWCESMDEQYPRLTYWHRHELIPFMYEHGYVNTWFGRRCDLPHVFAGPTLAEQARGKRKLSPQIAAERECVPLVIQGTAADLLKIAAQRVDAQLDEAWGYIVSFVHDELNLLVREDMVEHVCRNVLWTMLDGLLSPSLGVEIGVGTNWGELEDWTPEVTPLTT